MTGSLDSIGEDYLRRTEQAIPLGRLGEPVEIARAMLFPASDEAKYITGQTLVVDGGRSLPASVSAVCLFTPARTRTGGDEGIEL